MLHLAGILLYIIYSWLFIMEPVNTSRFRPLKTGPIGPSPHTMNDWTEQCRYNDTLSTFLTFGMGQSDTSVIIIANSKTKPNCIINFLTAAVGPVPIVYMILVIEFPDKPKHMKKVCVDNVILVSDAETENETFAVCDAVNDDPKKYATYFISEDNNITVEIYSMKTFDTVKLTATTGRLLTDKLDVCDNTSEIICSKDDRFDENINLCITQEVMCDTHNNCADPNDFDEDARICNVNQYSRLWIVVIVSLIMLIVIIFFLVRLLRSSVPRIGNTFFVFNEDEDNKLNLSTMYTSPVVEHQQKSIVSHMSRSSSYRFRAAYVSANADRGERRQSWAQDQLLKTYIRPNADEIEIRTEQPAIPLRSLLKPASREVNCNLAQSKPPAFTQVLDYKEYPNIEVLTEITSSNESKNLEPSEISCNLQGTDLSYDSRSFASLGNRYNASRVDFPRPSPYIGQSGLWMIEKTSPIVSHSHAVELVEAPSEHGRNLHKIDSTDTEIVDALREHHKERHKKKNLHPFAKIHSSRSITHRVLVHKHQDPEIDEDLDIVPDNLVYDPVTGKHHIRISKLIVDMSDTTLVHHEPLQATSIASKSIMKKPHKHYELEEYHSPDSEDLTPRPVIAASRKSDMLTFSKGHSRTSSPGSSHDNSHANSAGGSYNTTSTFLSEGIKEELLDEEPPGFFNALSSTHIMHLKLSHNRNVFEEMPRPSEETSHQYIDLPRPPRRKITYNPVIDSYDNEVKKFQVRSDNSKMPPRSILSSRITHNKLEEEYYKAGTSGIDGLVMEVRKKKRRIADVHSSTHIIHPRKNKIEKKGERNTKRRSSNSSDSSNDPTTL